MEHKLVKKIRKVLKKEELLAKYDTATVNVEEAAGYLGISIPTMRRYYSTGLIPSIRPGGKFGVVLFRTKSLDKWMEDMEEASYRPIYVPEPNLDYIV